MGERGGVKKTRMKGVRKERKKGEKKNMHTEGDVCVFALRQLRDPLTLSETLSAVEDDQLTGEKRHTMTRSWSTVHVRA